jgi:uncharacterized protein (TIGR02453 family)
MAPTAFRGWPADALAFHEQLATNNTRTWWHENKARYETAVRGPMLDLAAEVRDEFGPLHIFRPQRDTRFAKDKTPYKTEQGAVTESEGGCSYYVRLAADGLFAGTGIYDMAPDQLARYRAAVDGPAGEELQTAVDALRRVGYTFGGETLKTAPRGVAKDHPRIELLRHKGIYAGIELGPGAWLSSRRALDRITAAWRRCAPFASWLEAHVGPSELPPRGAR